MEESIGYSKKNLLGLISSALSLVIVFAASSSPIPLYSVYREQIGVINSDLTLATVLYFLGTMSALLLLSRITNYTGRKPAIYAVLMMSVLGCLVFMNMSAPWMLMVGRLIQGIACGLASSALTTYVVDCSPLSPKWIGPTVTSASPMVGLAGGSIISGAIKQSASGSTTLVFMYIIALTAVCFLLMLVSPETVAKKKGALATVVPNVRVPANIAGLLPGASAIFIGTWALGGFYQAFSSSITVEYLNSDSTLIAALVFASLMAPTVLGSTLVGSMSSAKGQKVGITCFWAGVMVVIMSLNIGSLALFLMASIFTGISHGMAFTGSMSRIVGQTSQEDRSGVMSTIYLISYGGAAVPNLVVGRVANHLSLLQVASGYGVLITVTALFALILLRRYEKKSVL